ncbi:MAG TPA: hypothetical protein VFD70_18425 [Anaerolineae bacterium]|nr:hypothetical protein [Anaerolineae bacterium]
MTDKEQATLKRVAKKLSAMRVTLSKDERAILDQLVLGASVKERSRKREVEGHQAKINTPEVEGHVIHLGPQAEIIPQGPKRASKPNSPLLDFDSTTGGYIPHTGH